MNDTQKEPAKVYLVQVLRTRCGCTQELGSPREAREVRDKLRYDIEVPLKNTKNYAWYNQPTLPTKITESRRFRHWGEVVELRPKVFGWIYEEEE